MLIFKGIEYMYKLAADGSFRVTAEVLFNIS